MAPIKNNQQLMAVVVLMMMLMAVSISSEQLGTINGKCVSLQGEPAEGVLLTTVTCDLDDPWQNNWVMNVEKVASTDCEIEVKQYCIQGTNLCNGYIKGDIFQKLVVANPDSLAQLWTSVPELPNQYKNLAVKLCDEAEDGFLVGRECQDIPAQKWADYDM